MTPTTKPTNPKDAIATNAVRFSAVPAGVLGEVAVALTEGALKYGRHNYRVAGVRASVYYDAALGHLMSWWEGEDIDADSGLSHVTKAIASLVVLRDCMMTQGQARRIGDARWVDDRPPRTLDRLWRHELKKQTAKLVAKCPGSAPTYTEKSHGGQP